MGWPSTEYHFKNMRDELYRDIEMIIQSEPFKPDNRIHLVIFTGDLTYSGTRDQFIEFSEALNHMWKFFDDKINSKPFFACIPGNHDLKRPTEGTNDYFIADNMKDKYCSDTKFNSDFWKNLSSSPQGKMIKGCFKDYVNWYEEIELPKLMSENSGILPGDFSAKFEQNDISIGLIGLNSAFLHLGDDVYEKLEINPQQFYAVCDDDPIQWLEEFDFTFLLTHHGVDWYHDKAKTRYHADIYKSERFTSHIYGHIHEAKTEINSISGAAARRYMIGKSLYGLKKYKDHKSNEEILRSHGYSILHLSVDNDHSMIKVFPRASILKSSGNYEIDRDQDFSLDKKDGSLTLFNKQIFKRRKKEKVSLGDIEAEEIREVRYADIYETREKILRDINYLKILKEIEDHVTVLWKRHTGTRWEPLHDSNHNRQVEKALYRLIPEDKFNNLEPYEWFILLASVWLHEIGMIIGLFKKEDEENMIEIGDIYALKVREIHEERAIRYIEEAHEILKITKYKESIQFCCRHHRKRIPIPKLSEEGLQKIQVNTPLLVAYLRLALATHLDVGIDEENLIELMHTPGLSWEDRFHWQKQKWIEDIIINHENYLIIVKAYSPPKESFLNEIFPEKLIEGMREGLLTVRDILAKGGISFFYDVEHDSSGIIDEEYINQMQLIRSNIDLEEISSASRAYETVLETFDKFTSDDIKKSGDLVHSYFKNIEKVLKYRPCHTLIRNLNTELSDIFKDEDASPEIKLTRIRDLIMKKKDDREGIITGIKENSKPFLLDKGSVLVYGYSTMVIHALSSIPENIRMETEIYVAECRGKTQFNLINDMIYNDGLQYVKKCEKMNFKTIHFIPDISIANLMKRGFISKVLFGANGIDRETGNFGHTCGHLMVANLASIYDVQLYVISDSSKIGKLQYDAETNRKINWLPEIKGYSELYSKINLLNPREDTVSSDLISMIITEKGIKYPKKNHRQGRILMHQMSNNEL